MKRPKNRESLGSSSNLHSGSTRRLGKWSLSLFLLCAPLLAAAQAQPGLLQQVRESSRAAQQLNSAREARFAKARDEQAAALRNAEAQVKQHEVRAANAKRRWTAARATAATLEKKLADASRDLQTLYDAARGAAVDLHDTAEHSLVTPQFPDRIAMLAPIAASQTLPGPAELETLSHALALEMEQSGAVVTVNAPVQSAEGTSQRPVTRIGTFTATAGDAYLILAPGGGHFVQLERQPRSDLRSIAEDFAALAQGMGTVLIDPSRGPLIVAEANRPGLFERLWHSGVGGYFIAAILLLAVVLAIAQSVWLRSRLIIDEQSIGVVVGVLLLFAIVQWWLLGEGNSEAVPDEIAQVELISEEPPSEDEQLPEPELTPPPPPASVPMPATMMAMAAVASLNAPAPVALSSTLSMPVKIGGGSLTGQAFGGFAGGSGAGGFGRGQGFSGKPLIPLSTARPQMPEWACKQGIKGWVEAVFTVLPTGRVQNVKIIDAQPRGVYEIAAIESINNWIYAETDKAHEVKQRVPMDPADCAYNWR